MRGFEQPVGLFAFPTRMQGVDGWAIGEIGCDLAWVRDIVGPGSGAHIKRSRAILISARCVVDLLDLQVDANRPPHLLQRRCSPQLVLISGKGQDTGLKTIRVF